MEWPRRIYGALWLLLLPFMPLKLWWRGRREAGYRAHIKERFGIYASAVKRPVLWIHAVSVGETRAAAPLIDCLCRAYPEATLLLTHTTATGRETGKALYGEHIRQAYLPYDAAAPVKRFLRHFRPLSGFLMETELWPNLIACCSEEGVPVFLINARLSERSAKRYAAWPRLTRPMFERLSGSAAQTRADAERLLTLGAKQVIVTGNLKFDVPVSDQALRLGREFRRRFGADRLVWVAGSTREGEEALILDALSRHPLTESALLVLVPRHPQRFDEIARLLHERHIAFVRRSDLTAVLSDVPANVGVVLGDSMGEMLSYYAAADVAFVGGSLLSYGGQNLIEPLALGKPVVIGTHTFNFAEIAALALEAKAARQVADAAVLVATVDFLLKRAHERAAMAAAATTFYAQHRGAGLRLWQWLKPQIDALH